MARGPAVGIGGRFIVRLNLRLDVDPRWYRWINRCGRYLGLFGRRRWLVARGLAESILVVGYRIVLVVTVARTTSGTVRRILCNARKELFLK